jgi:GT2 family glycosyltransferase
MLVELVQCILDGDEVPAEIVVIDDSDQPCDSLASLRPDRPCELRYRWNRSRGLGRANNTGVAVARHDVLTFTQDDMLVTPSWFGTLVRALVEAGPRTIVTGQVKPGVPETEGGFAPSTIDDEIARSYEGRIGRDVLYFQNAAFYRSAFDAVGGFDPDLGPGTRFPSAEDNDFGFRLLEAGYRIVYEPRAVTYHRAWRSDVDALELEWNYGRGQGAFYAKHLSLRDPHMLRRFAVDAGRHAVRLPIQLLRDRRQMRRSAAYLGGLVSAAAEWPMRRFRALPRAVLPPR